MTKPTTPLRQRMIEDMTTRNMSPLTRAAYIRSVANFAAHYRTSPDKPTFEDGAVASNFWGACGHRCSLRGKRSRAVEPPDMIRAR
jgi:hypothetical protein